MADGPTLYEAEGGLGALGGASLNITTQNNNVALALVAILLIFFAWRIKI